MVHRTVSLPVSLLVSFLTILAIATFSFSADPTTSPDVDLSSPKSAFRAYTTALMNGDHNGVMRTVIASPKGQKMLDGQMAYNAVEKRFRAATVKAFPDSAKELPDPFTDTLASIDAAEVATAGDTATLTSKQTMQPVKLKKQDGNWKIDLSAMYGDEVIDEVIQFRKALSDVMEGMTEDVTNGKFTDYNDVRSNLETHVKMRLAMPPAEDATTKP